VRINTYIILKPKDLFNSGDNYIHRNNNITVMKNKIKPTKNERIFPEDKILVSKTNAKGIITYCNHSFLEISGYSESELLGKQHNVVRHPDMPRVIFSLLWEILQSNREFNGYIKNLAKDGGYYWVFANVTPSYSSKNELLGYYSVSRKPEPEKLNYIQNLYLELLEIEQQPASKNAIDESRYKLDSVLNGREMGYDEFVLSI